MLLHARETHWITDEFVQVTVEGITLRLHLCADTMTALGAFGSDLGSAFSKHDNEPCVCSSYRAKGRETDI